MVTEPNTLKMLSFTRRNGSFTEHRCVASQSPWFVTHEVISTGPSIAEITSKAVISAGSFNSWYPPLEPCLAATMDLWASFWSTLAMSVAEIPYWSRSEERRVGKECKSRRTQ